MSSLTKVQVAHVVQAYVNETIAWIKQHDCGCFEDIIQGFRPDVDLPVPLTVSWETILAEMKTDSRLVYAKSFCTVPIFKLPRQNSTQDFLKGTIPSFFSQMLRLPSANDNCMYSAQDVLNEVIPYFLTQMLTNTSKELTYMSENVNTWLVLPLHLQSMKSSIVESILQAMKDHPLVYFINHQHHTVFFNKPLNPDEIEMIKSDEVQKLVRDVMAIIKTSGSFSPSNPSDLSRLEMPPHLEKDMVMNVAVAILLQNPRTLIHCNYQGELTLRARLAMFPWNYLALQNLYNRSRPSRIMEEAMAEVFVNEMIEHFTERMLSNISKQKQYYSSDVKNFLKAPKPLKKADIYARIIEGLKQCNQVTYMTASNGSVCFMPLKPQVAESSIQENISTELQGENLQSLYQEPKSNQRSSIVELLLDADVVEMRIQLYQHFIGRKNKAGFPLRTILKRFKNGGYVPEPLQNTAESFVVKMLLQENSRFKLNNRRITYTGLLGELSPPMQPHNLTDHNFQLYRWVFKSVPVSTESVMAQTLTKQQRSLGFTMKDFIAQLQDDPCFIVDDTYIQINPQVLYQYVKSYYSRHLMTAPMEELVQIPSATSQVNEDDKEEIKAVPLPSVQTLDGNRQKSLKNSVVCHLLDARCNGARNRMYKALGKNGTFSLKVLSKRITKLHWLSQQLQNDLVRSLIDDILRHDKNLVIKDDHIIYNDVAASYQPPIASRPPHYFQLASFEIVRSILKKQSMTITEILSHPLPKAFQSAKITAQRILVKLEQDPCFFVSDTMVQVDEVAISLCVQLLIVDGFLTVPKSSTSSRPKLQSAVRLDITAIVLTEKMLEQTRNGHLFYLDKNDYTENDFNALLSRLKSHPDVVYHDGDDSSEGYFTAKPNDEMTIDSFVAHYSNTILKAALSCVKEGNYFFISSILNHIGTTLPCHLSESEVMEVMVAQLQKDERLLYCEDDLGQKYFCARDSSNISLNPIKASWSDDSSDGEAPSDGMISIATLNLSQILESLEESSSNGGSSDTGTATTSQGPFATVVKKYAVMIEPIMLECIENHGFFPLSCVEEQLASLSLDYSTQSLMSALTNELMHNPSVSLMTCPEYGVGFSGLKNDSKPPKLAATATEPPEFPRLVFEPPTIPKLDAAIILELNTERLQEQMLDHTRKGLPFYLAKNECPDDDSFTAILHKLKAHPEVVYCYDDKEENGYFMAKSADIDSVSNFVAKHAPAILEAAVSWVQDDTYYYTSYIQGQIRPVLPNHLSLDEVTEGVIEVLVNDGRLRCCDDEFGRKYFVHVDHKEMVSITIDEPPASPESRNSSFDDCESLNSFSSKLEPEAPHSPAASDVSFQSFSARDSISPKVGDQVHHAVAKSTESMQSEVIRSTSMIQPKPSMSHKKLDEPLPMHSTKSSGLTVSMWPPTEVATPTPLMSLHDNNPLTMMPTLRITTLDQLKQAIANSSCLTNSNDTHIALDIHGQLPNSLIQIALFNQILLIDCHNIQLEPLQRTLQPIFESSSITKVVYDVHRIAKTLSEIAPGGVASIVDLQLLMEIDTTKYDIPFDEMLRHIDLEAHPYPRYLKQPSLITQRPLKEEAMQAAAASVKLLLQAYQEAVLEPSFYEASQLRLVNAIKCEGARTMCFDEANDYRLASYEILKTWWPEDLINSTPFCIHEDLSEVLALLPDDLATPLTEQTIASGLLDIVLDRGRRPWAWVHGARHFLVDNDRLVLQEDLDGIIEKVGGFGTDN